MDPVIDPVPGDTDETPTTEDSQIVSGDQPELADSSLDKNDDPAEEITPKTTEENISQDNEENAPSESASQESCVNEVSQSEDQPQAESIPVNELEPTSLLEKETEDSIESTTSNSKENLPIGNITKVVEAEVGNEESGELLKEDNINDDVEDSTPIESMDVDNDDVPEEVISEEITEKDSEIEVQNPIEADKLDADESEKEITKEVPEDKNKEKTDIEDTVQTVPLAESEPVEEMDVSVLPTNETSQTESIDHSEQPQTEEVDMEDVADTSISEKDKTFAEDPFDSVKQNTSFSNDKDAADTHDETDVTPNNTLNETGVSELNETNHEDSLVENTVESVSTNNTTKENAAEGKNNCKYLK